MNFKNLIEKKKGKGKDLMIIIIIIGALIAVLTIPTEQTKEKREEKVSEENITASGTYSPTNYEEELELRLEEILSQVEGVGQVEVMITMEASAKEVVEKDITMQQNSNSTVTDGMGDSSLSKEENTVFSDTNTGSVPYVVQEIYPKVEGVLVVAQGGDDSYVNLAITDAIQALFGVDVHKIKIVKMNTN